ncbi:stage III sporulation protein AA [Heyndrickxia acidicola]|uniref:Stage III sporulation protein AA n=1 Tax=Heyndrickxia acidicola TaxID=209389 RepID=A0ABU6MKF5_9BACI|nr:stage III sporulation protein AA [Heyndrickxia acidicola]MED1205167.1 stage III sporulation protein AA [Heyndrickxia acidicola]
MDNILAILPHSISEMIHRLPDNNLEKLEEVRLRINRPIELMAGGNSFFLPYRLQEKDAEQFLDKLANYSFYTLEEELKKGYITVEGGHRVGLAGKVILEEGHVKAIRNVSSFNIRIAREKIGAALPLVPQLFKSRWRHTMIIGAPQTGKTTVLRDLARIVSSGIPEKKIPPLKVGIVDERSEIAGCVRGVPQLHFGPRLDVLDACPKAEGMMMLIRSMSPDVLIVDEIGREEDSQAIMEAVNAGVTLIMTTHGHSYEDLHKRPILRKIIQESVFERFIELTRSNGPGTIHRIYDEKGNGIPLNAGVQQC